MSSRPRRSAAQRATAAITDMADRDNERTMSSRSRRSGGATATRGPPSSPGGSSQAEQHMQVTVKVPSNKLRQATSGQTNGGSSSRRRGNVKSYVVESDSDEDDDDDEEEDEIEVGARAGMLGDDDDDDEMEEDDDEEDAEGEADEMDIDAEGEEEDAEGDIEMDIPPPAPPAITVSKPSKGVAAPAKAKTSPPRASGRGVAVPVKHTAAPRLLDDDDDDDELSELESEPEEVDMGLGDEDAEGEDEEIEDVDAEGEDEIEVADEDAEGEEEELDSEDGSRAGTPDLSKLTARQRARLGDASHEYLKLSDEVQAKKVFTAEELSMRRLEMARRRRNLSEKRNEEVKMETINKLLKKQAPKTNRRHALAGYETPDGESNRADPLFVRWVSSKDGNRIGVPDDMVIGPVGRVFLGGAGLARGKMVEEVS
ncbi:PAPA-1-like conserved region-domain-containing protein [Podospora conica]|nr:PAPA-1-like conserved region-domain-containing protein [Schizothecium conicum]